MSRKNPQPNWGAGEEKRSSPIKYLTYAGDVRHMVGSDPRQRGDGKYVSVVTAKYDEDTDTTRVGFADLGLLLQEGD